jgi:hypothetical protein
MIQGLFWWVHTIEDNAKERRCKSVHVLNYHSMAGSAGLLKRVVPLAMVVLARPRYYPCEGLQMRERRL